MAATRLVYGDLYADVLHDTRGPTELWLYVVQREGSPEVLAMGQCSSEESAKDLARKYMHQFGAASSASAAS